MLRVKTKKRSGILLGLGATLLAAAVFGVVIYKSPAQTTNAASESITGGSPVSGRVNQQLAISDLSISGTGNDTLPVKLHVDSGNLYMSTTTGLTFTGATIGSTLDFSGTRNDVNTALATLHYVGATAGSQTLTVSLADQNTIFNPSNNHVYQYIPGTIDWYDARDAAAASTYQGVPGYLATITSDNENQFIKDRLNGNAWLGASDDDQYLGEGNWSWIAGPEANTNFYDGEGSGGSGGGAAIDGAYANWNPGEPNNSNGNEDCMETYIADGTWNDLPCNTTVDGYVVEYGDNNATPSDIPTADVTITTVAATFAGGDGTPQAPYQIADCEQLQDLNQDLSANYVLTHNIDCTDTPNWNGGQGFEPIGTNDNSSNPFTGKIDGAGFSIDGLTEIRADDDSSTDDSNDAANNQDYVGLIGYGEGVRILDVHLTHAKIKGYKYVGGLVGYMYAGNISNSSVNQGIDESSDTSCTPGYCVWARYGWYGGGLVGFMNSGNITSSTVGGLVKGSGNVIGGLAGNLEGAGQITYSQSTAAIDGGAYIGGVVGEMSDYSSLIRVSATGNVIAKVDDEVGKVGYYAGGLVGFASVHSTITQSYATGNVHADDTYAGGLVGYMSTVTAHDVYATGDVSAGNALVGGLIGAGDSNIIERAYASGHVEADSNDAGGFIGPSNGDSISDSFATESSVAPYSSGAFNGDDGSSIVHSHNYFDITTTGSTMCNPSTAETDCQGVNAANSQPNYFISYNNEPFQQDGTQVWDNTDVWYFDGVNNPTLRMGTNQLPSVLPSDYDNDGVSTVVENAAPNNGDGNNDGTQDSTQMNVVSFVNPVTNKYVTLEVDDACSITAATSGAESAASADRGYSYPFGLMNYTVDCGTPGFSADVSIYYHDVSDTSGLVVRKYNSTNNTYMAVPSAVISGTNPVKVTYTIVDGSALDEDGTRNGIIVDPVGLAAVEVGAPNTGLKPENISVVIVSGVAGIVLVGTALFMVRRASKKHGEN